MKNSKITLTKLPVWRSFHGLTRKSVKTLKTEGYNEVKYDNIVDDLGNIYIKNKNSSHAEYHNTGINIGERI